MFTGSKSEKKNYLDNHFTLLAFAIHGKMLVFNHGLIFQVYYYTTADNLDL